MPVNTATTDGFESTAPKPTSRLRLFCFPYAGGGSNIFRNWPRQLPSDVEVVTPLPPVCEGRFREPPLDRIERVIDAVTPDILPWLDRPFAFVPRERLEPWRVQSQAGYALHMLSRAHFFFN
ncbi:MAG TPA: thioesterase domain-containing protein [Pyrinomonadaceae bacterium]|jgi:medium-chain acyl-[acyl-carrier-protein] hydrolase